MSDNFRAVDADDVRRQLGLEGKLQELQYLYSPAPNPSYAASSSSTAAVTSQKSTGKHYTADKHSDFVATIAEDCRKREAHQRKIVDSVHLIPEGYKADGWKGVYQRLQRVIQLTSLAGSSETPLYVETMYKILEHGMNNASQQRSEAEFEQLREFRSRIYEMVQDAIDTRHATYCTQVDWETANLPQWREKFQAVEEQDNYLARLQAICQTCDVIWEQKENLLSAETAVPASRSSETVLEESDEDDLPVGLRSDAYREKQKLPDDELRRVHAASNKHGMEGQQCKPCHFPPGQCWQGSDCPYCHICDKPKRKSKTQRMVEKRRQERYKMIESTGNELALQAVKTVDEARRKFLTGSESLKQDLKDKLSQGSDVQREEAEQKLQKLGDLMAQLEELVPRERETPTPAS